MKPKRGYNKHARDIKKVTGGAPITPRKGEWEIARIEDKRGVPKDGNGRKGLSEDALMSAAKERAGGATIDQLHKKYGVAATYLDEALKRLFTNSKIGREILKGVFRDNAIACGMHVAANIGKLQPMQAAQAARIFSDGLINQEKHETLLPKEVDVENLGEIQRLLKNIDESVTIDAEDGSILD